MSLIKLAVELLMIIPRETLLMGVVMDPIELLVNVAVLLAQLVMLLGMLIVAIVRVGHCGRCKT